MVEPAFEPTRRADEHVRGPRIALRPRPLPSHAMSAVYGHIGLTGVTGAVLRFQQLPTASRYWKIPRHAQCARLRRLYAARSQRAASCELGEQCALAGCCPQRARTCSVQTPEPPPRGGCETPIAEVGRRTLSRRRGWCIGLPHRPHRRRLRPSPRPSGAGTGKRPCIALGSQDQLERTRWAPACRRAAASPRTRVHLGGRAITVLREDWVTTW